MAAVTQGQIKFKIEFDIVNSTFKFTDQTTYDDYTTVKGAIKIDYKGVTVWDNLANIETTPDIDGSSVGQANEALLRSNTTPTPINLPTTLNGEYTVTYSIKEGVLDPITATVTFDYSYVAPNGDLDATVDLTLTSPSIKIVDNTNYKVSDITPTGTPTIKLYYPADVDLPEVSEQTSLLTVINFYTGTQIGVLDADKVWDYTSKVTDTTFTEGYATIFTLDTITDRINIPVESNGDICTIFCCLKDFENRLSLSKSNPTKYQELSDIAGKVGFYFSSILAAFECGKTENVNDWITEIRSLVNCNEDCGCDGSEPILISPINGETVGYNLTVDDGTTSVSNVTGVSFSGATLTDDGDGQVTVSITGGGGGATTFTGLTDTPSAYSGQSGKLTQVNSVESAVEFTSTPVVDSIQLSGGTGSQGEVTWDTDNETLNLVQNGIDLKVGQDVQIHVTLHGSAASVAQGDAVVAVGTTGGSGKILVCKASVSEYNTCTGLSVTEIPAKYVIGVAAEAITNNGKVTSFGKVAGSGFTQNSVYYVNESTGGLTLTKPTSGLEMPIAFAINSSLLMVRTTPINELLIEHGETAYTWGNHASAGYLTEIKQDTTPQLGGDLDLNNSRIISVSNQDIEIIPDGTGRVTLGNFVFKTSQVPSGTEDNYVLTYDDTAGTIQLEAVSGGGGGTVTEVTANAPLSVTSGTSTPDLSIAQATSAASGYLSSTDWNTFSGKLSDIVDDITPQLGGNLDVNGSRIVSVTNGDIMIMPDGTGNVYLGNFRFRTDQAIGAGEDNHVLTYDFGSGTISLEPSAGGGGTVTSVGLSVPTGFAVTGSPVTASGTLALAFDTGYSLPTTAAFNQKIDNIVEDTTPQLGGTLDAVNNDITNVNKITAKEFVADNQTVTSTAGVVTVDAISGTFAEITLSEDITTFNVRNMVKGEPLTIMINTGAGSFAVSGWQKDGSAPNFLWSGGTAPTITTTASKVDIVTLICDGTNIYAAIVQDF